MSLNHSIELVEQNLKLNQALILLFERHDVDGKLVDEHVVFPEELIRAHCHVYDRTTRDISLVQLDIILEFGFKKNIIASSTGMGDDIDTAIKNAFENYISTYFHVMLAAFFNLDYDKQVARYQWKVGDQELNAISSHLSIKGQAPDLGRCPWISLFEKEVQNLNLPAGIHSTSLFYAVMNNNILSTEVLLNNNVCNNIQEKAAMFDIPLTEAYYSMRLFYIVQNGLDINRLATIIAWSQSYSEDEDEAYDKIFLLFEEMGLNEIDIQKAYIMIPLAISHVFIKDIAPSLLTTEAIIMNEKEEVFEIDLKNEFLYVQTLNWAENALAEGIIDQESLMILNNMSSTFNLLNEALNDGVKIEDLSLSENVIYIASYKVED